MEGTQVEKHPACYHSRFIELVEARQKKDHLLPELEEESEEEDHNSDGDDQEDDEAIENGWYPLSRRVSSWEAPAKKEKAREKKTSQRTFRSGSDANADGTQMYTRTIMA